MKSLTVSQRILSKAIYIVIKAEIEKRKYDGLWKNVENVNIFIVNKNLKPPRNTNTYYMYLIDTISNRLKSNVGTYYEGFFWFSFRSHFWLVIIRALEIVALKISFQVIWCWETNT